MLVATVVLVLGALYSVNGIRQATDRRYSCAIGRPEANEFPVMVAEPTLPGDTRMPLYRKPVVVKVRAAVW